MLLPEAKDGLLSGLPEQVVVANATKHRHPGCYLRHTQLLTPLTVNQSVVSSASAAAANLTRYVPLDVF